MSPSNQGSLTQHTLYTNCVLNHIQEQGHIQPDQTALVFKDQAISYESLCQRIDQLAGKLLEQGVGAGAIVGLGMHRSAELVIAMLAVWRVGAAFVPLDVDYPSYRLNQIIADAQPDLIICDQDSIHSASWANQPTWVPAETPSLTAQDFQQIPVAADAVAYVIFTSGSTGRPKGVRIAIAALKNFLESMQEPLGFQNNDVWLAITAHSFDISILEIMLPLSQGGTLVLADRNDSGDGHHLQQLIKDVKASFLQATPATWQLLLDADWPGENNLTAICGGENFPRPLAEDLLTSCGRVFNAYGPTEATIWALVERVNTGTGPVPIGTPLANYQAYVMDDDMQDVKTGEVGQLYLAGKSLAIDYINQPDETAKYFIQHPTRGRVYATGDLVNSRPDGKLEFVGRKDQQVKVRGHRIELGEIEAQLLNIPEIKEAAVTIHTDERQHTKILAYIIFESSSDMAAEVIRKLLAERIPTYMMPNHFIPMSQFPLTHNKKVDRKQLPLPNLEQSAKAPELNDPLEKYLQQVWGEILGVSNLAADHDFFDLGGDSILAARITNRVQDWLGELLWPVIIFDAPTIQQLAVYLKENYPESVAKKTDQKPMNQPLNTEDRVVDDALIQAFNQLNPPMVVRPNSEPKNPRAIFLLCPPRSGSTLLRVMLAGNQQIFAPPEIEMLTFNSLQERSQTFSGRESYRVEGLTRAVMEIKGCDVDEANDLLGEYERQGSSIQQFYGQLQHWLGDRMLLDKTPANCLDLAALNRIEHMFDDPLYIHLTRHPYGMIRSFLEARLAAVFFRRVEHGFSPRELAELIWYTCNNNIKTMLQSVPADRQFTIGFEQLLAAPENHVKQMAEFLGVAYHPDMIEPHRNKENKMTDGLHKESKMMGDPKFHQHKSIDASVAERWKKETPETALGIKTDQLAVSLGYESTIEQEEDREDFIL